MIDCCLTEKPLMHKTKPESGLNFIHLYIDGLFDCCLTEKPLLHKADSKTTLYFKHLRRTDLFDFCLTDELQQVLWKHTAELATTGQKIDQQRSEIDDIVAEIAA